MTRARLVGALGVAAAVLIAAASLGAFSRTADVGAEAVAVARDATRRPAVPAIAQVRVAGRDGVVLQHPMVPPSERSTGTVADGDSVPRGSSIGPGAALAPGAPARAVVRDLASIGTYNLGDWICHWNFTGIGQGVYNNNRADPAYWLPVQLTSVPVAVAHAGDVRDYGPQFVPQPPTAADCASGSPPG